MYHPIQLQQLADFEKQIKNLHIQFNDTIQVSFSKDGNQILLNINSKSYTGFLGQELMHQLGNRIFPTIKTDFNLIKSKWKLEQTRNANWLKQSIINALKSNELTLKYFQKNGTNVIYGIVSSRFQEINQLEFRAAFIGEMKSITDFQFTSNLSVNRYGQLIEEFIPHFSKEQVAYSYCLIHGRNNGYNAIKMHWSRKIIICQNGLTKFEGEKFVLNHTQNQCPKSFLQHTIDEGIKNYNFINHKINRSLNMELVPAFYTHFLGGIVLANATKDRIQNRFKIEAQITGNSEWSLSQSLTWLAEHEKSISVFTKKILRDAGTSILENGLEDFISQKTIIKEFDKRYIVFENPN